MALLMGLDVSTSIIGVCLMDDAIKPDDKGSHIILLDHIAFKGCETIWDKADVVREYMADVIRGSFEDERLPWQVHCPLRVILEEPLMGFRPGMSSAQTISTLMRFNGIVSYITRVTFKCDPEYIGSAHARKLCGVKLQRTALGGPQKEQVFAHMVANDLKHVQWPVKKNGKQVDWSRDVCDAYVIARAATISGPIQPLTKKAKKGRQTT